MIPTVSDGGPGLRHLGNVFPAPSLPNPVCGSQPNWQGRGSLQVERVGLEEGTPVLAIQAALLSLPEGGTDFVTSAASQPLFGKRILIARPEGQSAVTADKVKSLGAEAIEVPLITFIEPPDPGRISEAVRRIEHYDLVAFTSENAVVRFCSEIEALGRSSCVFDKIRIAAIGIGTANALEHMGICVHIVPSTYVGEALAEAILGDPTIQALLSRRSPRVLIPRALKAREVVPERLREAGCIVDIVHVYETRPAPTTQCEDLIARLEARTIDCVLLTSSSTTDSLIDLLGARVVELLQGVLVASIGPITTVTAENHGLTVGVTAVENSLAGLLSALESYFAKDIQPATVTDCGEVGGDSRRMNPS